jgi:anti-sigma regulatory factor (Ser/Thr protein kinase)
MTECIDASRTVGPLHAAVVYDSDDALVDRAAPFVRDALDREETIFAVVPSQVQWVLRSVLGGDGDRVHWREPDGRPVDSPDHVEPSRYLETHDGSLSTVPDPVALDLPVTSPGDLRPARAGLYDYASSVDHGPGAAERVAVAAHEVIGNALRHGRPPCRVRAWRSAGVLHVRIDDGGPGAGVATAGYGRPATSTSPGMGLWVTRQLTDVVHIRAGHTYGTSVELQFR